MTNQKEMTKFPSLRSEGLAAVDPKTDYANEIKQWTSYTQYLAALAGVVKTVDGVLLKSMGDNATYKDIDGALRAFYLAIQGVDNEFVNGIDDMKKGNAPTYTFDPVNVPDWSVPSDTDAKGTKTILDGIWQTAKPLLESVLGKIKESSNPNKAAFETAVVGLINSGDNVVAELEKIFTS